MHPRTRDAGAALLAVAALGYGLLVRQLYFGLAAAAGVAVAYATWSEGETEHAVVLLVLWGAVTAAVWTRRLRFVVPAVLGTAVAYIGWRVWRGRETPPT